MTTQEALDTIPYWQKRLRLMDWTITGKVVDRPAERGGLAYVRQSAKYKCAEICILSADRVDPAEIINTDPEVSVVHELLHLQSEQLNRFLAKPKHAHLDNHMERLVELTAIALVDFRREVEKAASDEEVMKRYADYAKRMKGEHGIHA